LGGLLSVFPPTPPSAGKEAGDTVVVRLEERIED
jgi:hypothetical protein